MSLTKDDDELTIRTAPEPSWRTLELTGPQPLPDTAVLVRAGPKAWPAGLLEKDQPLRFAARSDAAVWLVTAYGRKTSVAIPESADTPWGVAPPSPMFFTGRVMDAATRRPLAGSLVWMGADPGRWVTTGADGRYRLSAPVSGRFWVQAEAPGYRARATWISPEQAATGEAPTLALTPAVGIRGRVVDAAGEPLPRARATAVARRRSPTESTAFGFDPADGRTFANVDGAFLLTGLEPGRDYDLYVSQSGYSAARLPVTAPAPRPGSTADAREVVVRLDPARAAYGRVIDEQDRPIEGAEVALSTAGARRPPLYPEEERSDCRGTSDAEGRFFIHRIPAEEIEIKVLKEGFAPLAVRGVKVFSDSGLSENEGPKNDRFDLGTVVLAAAVVLTGQVVDTEGSGLADVPIFVVPTTLDPESVAGSLARRPPDTRTQADGHFRLTRFTPGDRMHLFAGGTGHAGVWVEHLRVPLAKPLRIVVEPGLSIGGRVVDSAGVPIADAELELTWTEHLSGLDVATYRPGQKTRRSNVEGRFAFFGLRPGPAKLIAWAPGFQESEPRILELVPVEESAPPQEVVITLERGALLRGVVRTATRPLDGVRLSAGRSGAFSDAEGRYRLDGVAPGAVRVEAHHPHYGTRSREIEVRMGENTLDLTFPDGHEIRGLVVDSSGRPLENVALELESWQHRSAVLYRTRSEDSGLFRLAPVAPGDYEIKATRPGWVLRQPRRIRVDTQDAGDIRVVLERGAVVAGTVLGLDFDEMARLRLSAEDSGGRSLEGRVDYTGAYEIRDLPPGYWVVRAMVDGGRRQVQERLEILPGGEEVRRDLSFSERFVLSGTVLLGGEPLPATRVSLAGRDLAVKREVTTDHQGGFRIEDLERATYNLGISHSRELVILNRDVELSGHRDVVLDLAPARLRGTVVDADNARPLADALVVLVRLSQTGEESNTLTVVSQADGAFDFPRAPPGLYRLSVHRDGYAAAGWQLELADAEQRDLELEVHTAPGAELHVRLASGGVPASVSLVIRTTEGKLLLRESRPVESDGSVLLPTIPHGLFRLIVQSPGTVASHATLRVPSEPMALTLEPAGLVEVRVPDLVTTELVAYLELHDADQQPWASLDPYGQLVSTWRLVGGRATLEGVPAGLWSVRVTTPDGQSWAGSLTAVAGSHTVVELH